jgi:hypothetical protein
MFRGCLPLILLLFVKTAWAIQAPRGFETTMTPPPVRDPSLALELAKSCKPATWPFNPGAPIPLFCLRDIAAFGPPARAAGEFLTPFLSSSSGDERAIGILTLGFIDYTPAIPAIEDSLDYNDWRAVYAAILAVGWFGDQHAVAKLDKLASTYWLVELRDDAARVAAALRSPQGHVERGTWKAKDSGWIRDPTFAIFEGFRGSLSSCPDNLWQWQGEKFKLKPIRENRDADEHFLKLQNGKLRGTLVGIDRGEFGGGLKWNPRHGHSELLTGENVHGIEPDGDGAIALVGLAHLGFNYGYALALGPNADGSLNLKDVARLPGEPRGWTRLQSGRLAVLTAGRVVVFSSTEGILGVASCASQ